MIRLDHQARAWWSKIAQEHRCLYCGAEIGFKDGEVYHKLPWWQFWRKR